jgi:hypothetical protein
MENIIPLGSKWFGVFIMRGLLMLNLGDDLFGGRIFLVLENTEVFLSVKLEMVPRLVFWKDFRMTM